MSIETPTQGFINLPLKESESTVANSSSTAGANRVTVGEKKFDQLNWWLNYAVTFVNSVVIAYLVRDSSVKVPWKNKEGERITWEQQTQQWRGQLIESKALSRFKDSKLFTSERLADIIINTCATFPGGFLTLPVTYWMEKNKKSIVHRLNEKLGTPEDIEQGDKNTADHVAPGWGSLLLGRLTSFTTVLVSFMALEKIIPKTMQAFCNDVEGIFASIGNWFSKLGGNEKMGPKWEKRVRKFGDLSAIDSIATAASVTILFISSKFFSNGGKSSPSSSAESTAASTPSSPVAYRQADTTPTAEEAPSKQYANEAGPKTPAEKAPPRKESYSESRRNEKEVPAGTIAATM